MNRKDRSFKFACESRAIKEYEKARKLQKRIPMNVRSRKKSEAIRHVTFKTEREMAAWMAKKISKAKKSVCIVWGDSN